MLVTLTAIHLPTNPLPFLANDLPRGALASSTGDAIEFDFGAIGQHVINVWDRATVSVN